MWLNNGVITVKFQKIGVSQFAYLGYFVQKIASAVTHIKKKEETYWKITSSGLRFASNFPETDNHIGLVKLIQTEIPPSSNFIYACYEKFRWIWVIKVSSNMHKEYSR